MPPLLQRPRCTRLSPLAHPYTVQIPYARVNQYFHSSIPSTGKLWNSLPLSVFPPAYDLDVFKRGVSRHLVNSLWASFWISFSLLWRQRESGIFFPFLFYALDAASFSRKKKKKKKNGAGSIEDAPSSAPQPSMEERRPSTSVAVKEERVITISEGSSDLM